MVALAFAHGTLLHIQIGVFRGVGDHRVDLGVDLRHRVEVVVGGDFYGGRAKRLAVHQGGQAEVAAYVQVSAAIGVGNARIAAKVADAVETYAQIHLAVHRLGERDHIGEKGRLSVGQTQSDRAPPAVWLGYSTGSR